MTHLNILNSFGCQGEGCQTGSCSSGFCRDTDTNRISSVAAHHQPCGSASDSRRQFLQSASTLVFGSFTLTLLPMWPGSDAESGAPPASETSAGDNSPQPPENPNPGAGPVMFGFLVDTDKCVGSGKCLSACRVENNVPEGYSRTWVERYVHFRDGRVQVDLVPESGYHDSGLPEIDSSQVEKAYFVPKLCNHCADAPCNQVCPVHASITSPEGVELVDPDRCIGCGYCVQACPYGVRFLNPETNNADKCTWCYHRITQNLGPACVEACPAGARVFGRLDDPESELSRRLASVREQVLKEHLGTHPKTRYAGLSGEVI